MCEHNKLIAIWMYHLEPASDSTHSSEVIYFNINKNENACLQQYKPLCFSAELA